MSRTCSAMFRFAALTETSNTTAVWFTSSTGLLSSSKNGAEKASCESGSCGGCTTAEAAGTTRKRYFRPSANMR